MEQYRESFLAYLTSNLNVGEPERLYEPIAYIMSLGGKRMRPVLVLMGCDLFEKNYSEALEAAMSVEMFHNFTLIHDDIMDNAELRRGKITVHKKWGLNAGILSGDALMIQAAQRLEYYKGETFKALMSLYHKTALEVCEGQQLDIDFESRPEVDMDEYLRMISFKTAVLVGASLKMGAIVGGASKEDQLKIYNFGLNLGIAFQLQDDYLDTYGGLDFGKRIGGDIIEGKKTFLYIKALESLNEDGKRKLFDLYAAKVEEKIKIKEVKEIFNTTGVAEELLKRIEDYTQLALSTMKEMSLDPVKKRMLREFALNLMNRKT